MNCIPSMNGELILPADHEKHVEKTAKCQSCLAKFGEQLSTECCPSLPIPSIHPYLMKQPDPYAACMAVMGVKALVTGFMHESPTTTVDGSEWPTLKSTIAMTGLRRLNSVEWLITDCLSRGVPGDFIETGVWRGGTSAVAATTMRILRGTGRTTFLADSFQGIPDVDLSQYPKDKAHESTTRMEILDNNSEENVVKLLSSVGLFGYKDYPIVLLKGYFNESLPKARAEGKFKNGFAMIRLDGDTYMSTMQAIEVLYPLLHVGGFVVVDDFTDWIGCFAAIMDHRKLHHITTPIVPVYHAQGERVRGVWFRKLKS